MSVNVISDSSDKPGAAYGLKELFEKQTKAVQDYKKDSLYLDIFNKNAYPSAIRFDYDPSAAKDVVHPYCHLTLGQFANCRISVQSPLSPP
mgnify:CR=1 FL=1